MQKSGPIDGYRDDSLELEMDTMPWDRTLARQLLPSLYPSIRYFIALFIALQWLFYGEYRSSFSQTSSSWSSVCWTVLLATNCKLHFIALPNGVSLPSMPTVRKRRVRERKGEREMEMINKIDKNQITGLFYWQVSASFSCSSSSNPPQAHFIGIFMNAEQPLDQFSRSPSLSRDNKLIRNCLLIINYDRNRFPTNAKGDEVRKRGTNKYRSIIIELKEPPPPPLAPVQEQDHPG